MSNDLIQLSASTISFEFFPPKNPEMADTLWETISKLGALSPEFVSVTYGAGGTTQGKTLETLQHVVGLGKFPAAGHLTCVGKSREEVNAVALAYKTLGVRHIVALRGDAPVGMGTFTPHPEGYQTSAELVAGLKALGDFHISVGAYPEKHPESASVDVDVEHLKRKMDAGADQALTQFFFDNEAFLRFRDKADQAGITMPIIPGILPIMNFQTTRSFAEKCGTSIPPHLYQMFDGLDQDTATRQMIAASVATAQCRELQKEGISHFHFYTLNRFELTLAVCRLLGLR